MSKDAKTLKEILANEIQERIEVITHSSTPQAG
jgi:hypothetical protein